MNPDDKCRDADPSRWHNAKENHLLSAGIFHY